MLGGFFFILRYMAVLYIPFSLTGKKKKIIAIVIAIVRL
jgi:hypothetical protein